MSRLTPEYRRKWYAAHPLYATWSSIRRLCGITKGASKKQLSKYADCGISICEDWRDDYKIFEKWCLDNGWERGKQVARIDKGDSYSPKNCIVTTWDENVNMRRNTVRVDGVAFRKVVGKETNGRGDTEYRRMADRYCKCKWDAISSCMAGIVPCKEGAYITARIRNERGL